jgi:hypothetical protein
MDLAVPDRPPRATRGPALTGARDEPRHRRNGPSFAGSLTLAAESRSPGWRRQAEDLS